MRDKKRVRGRDEVGGEGGGRTWEGHVLKPDKVR